MAQLDDTLVQGDFKVTGSIYGVENIEIFSYSTTDTTLYNAITSVVNNGKLPCITKDSGPLFKYYGSQANTNYKLFMRTYGTNEPSNDTYPMFEFFNVTSSGCSEVSTYNVTSIDTTGAKRIWDYYSTNSQDTYKAGKYINVMWGNSDQVTANSTLRFLTGFYTSSPTSGSSVDGAEATMCDIPPSQLIDYLNAKLKYSVETTSSTTQIAPKTGYLEVLNSNQTGLGNLRAKFIDATFLCPTNTQYTLSIDTADQIKGKIFRIGNDNSTDLTIKYTDRTGNNAYATISSGYYAEFIVLQDNRNRVLRLST